MGLAGFIAYHHSAHDEVFVDYVCTSKTHRRKGIARRLLNSFGSVRVTLIVVTFSRPHKIYTKLGFLPISDGPYEAKMGEVCLTRQQAAAECPTIQTLDADRLPREELSKLLREVGLGNRGIHHRFVRCGHPEMRYRVVYAQDASATRQLRRC